MFSLIFFGFNISSVLNTGKGAFEITRKLCGDSKALELAQECFLSNESCHKKLNQTFVATSVFDFMLDSFVANKCKPNGNQSPSITISSNQTFDYGKDSNLSIWTIVSSLNENTVNFTFDPDSKGIFLQVEEERIMCSHELKKRIQNWFDQSDYRNTSAIVYAKEYFERRTHQYADYLDKIDGFAGSDKHKMFLASVLSGKKVPKMIEKTEDVDEILIFRSVIDIDNDENCQLVHSSKNASTTVNFAKDFFQRGVFGFKVCASYNPCVEFLKKFTRYECMASFVASSITGTWPLEDQKNESAVPTGDQSFDLCRKNFLEYGDNSCNSVSEKKPSNNCGRVEVYVPIIKDLTDPKYFQKIYVEHKLPECTIIRLNAFTTKFMVEAKNYISSKKNDLEKYLARLKATVIYSKMVTLDVISKYIRPNDTPLDFLMYSLATCRIQQIPNLNVLNTTQVFDYIEEIRSLYRMPYESCKEDQLQNFKVAFHVSSRRLLKCDLDGNIVSLKPKYSLQLLEGIIEESLNRANSRLLPPSGTMDMKKVICEKYLF